MSCWCFSNLALISQSNRVESSRIIICLPTWPGKRSCQAQRWFTSCTLLVAAFVVVAVAVDGMKDGPEGRTQSGSLSLPNYLLLSVLVRHYLAGEQETAAPN